jgi:hypothetical protein
MYSRFINTTLDEYEKASCTLPFSQVALHLQRSNSIALNPRSSMQSLSGTAWNHTVGKGTIPSHRKIRGKVLASIQEPRALSGGKPGIQTPSARVRATTELDAAGIRLGDVAGLALLDQPQTWIGVVPRGGRLHLRARRNSVPVPGQRTARPLHGRSSSAEDNACPQTSKGGPGKPPGGRTAGVSTWNCSCDVSCPG